MRRIKVILLGICVIIPVLLVACYFFLGSIIKAGIETVGPNMTKTSITVGSVTLSPFTGKGRIRRLVVGNPPGFTSDAAIKMKDFRINLVLSSLSKHVIHIRSIVIEGPEITKEGSNLSTIQKNVQSFTATDPGARGEKGPSKRVIVDDLWIKEAKVHLELLGKMSTLSIPDIHLTEIGKGSGGVTPSQVIDRALGSILSSAASGGKDAGQAVSRKVEKIRGGLKGLFRKK